MVGDSPQLSVFHPVLCFRYTCVETWGSLIRFDGHMLFGQFPSGCRAQAGMPLCGLPWQVFLEVELLNHGACSFAAWLASANLFCRVCTDLFPQHLRVLVSPHSHQCFTICANLIGCGMASHLHTSDHQWVEHYYTFAEYLGLQFNKIAVQILISFLLDWLPFIIFILVGTLDTSWEFFLYLLCILQMPFSSVLLINELCLL